MSYEKEKTSIYVLEPNTSSIVIFLYVLNYQPPLPTSSMNNLLMSVYIIDIYNNIIYINIIEM